MENKYLSLDKDSICNNCMGCGRLENSYFRGTKGSQTTCLNFRDCYSNEEKAEILREKNAYGSMYGNNN